MEDDSLSTSRRNAYYCVAFERGRENRNGNSTISRLQRARRKHRASEFVNETTGARWGARQSRDAARSARTAASRIAKRLDERGCVHMPDCSGSFKSICFSRGSNSNRNASARVPRTTCLLQNASEKSAMTRCSSVLGDRRRTENISDERQISQRSPRDENSR